MKLGMEHQQHQARVSSPPVIVPPSIVEESSANLNDHEESPVLHNQPLTPYEHHNAPSSDVKRVGVTGSSTHGHSSYLQVSKHTVHGGSPPLSNSVSTGMYSVYYIIHLNPYNNNYVAM